MPPVLFVSPPETGPTMGDKMTIGRIVAVAAVVCATTNIVGGFLITDRMLKMFKRKDTPAKTEAK